jgi:hypothetical protein
MPQPLYSWRKNPQYTLDMELSGFQGQYAHGSEGKDPTRNWIPVSSPYLVTDGAMPSPQSTSYKARPHHWADTELCLRIMLFTSVISYGTHSCATGTARQHMKRIKYLQENHEEMWVWQGKQQKLTDYTDEKSWEERESRHSFTDYLHNTL